MNQRHDEDFAQLRGAFDAPIAPSPVFANRLREQVTMELTAQQQVSPDTQSRESVRLIATPRPMPVTFATGWTGALMTAATIGVVLALVFGALRLTTDRNGGNDDTPPSAPALASTNATPAASTVSPMDTGWGGADRSFNMGVDAPELGDEVGRIGDQFLANNQFSQFVGDYLIDVEYDIDDTTPGKVTAIELESGKTAWSIDLLINGGFASDGNLLFGWNSLPDSQWKMVAIDIHTGEIVWSEYDPVRTATMEWSMGPVYADGLVYFTSGSLGIVAVEAQTGDVVWLHQQDSLIEIIDPDNTRFTNQARIPALALSDGHVLVVWEGRVVESFDPKTGVSQWEHQLPDSENEVSASSMMIADDDYAYIQRFTSGGEGALLALELDTRFIAWERDDTAATMPPALAETGLIVTLADTSVALLDRATGKTSSLFAAPKQEIRPPDITVANGRVYVAWSSIVYEFDASSLSTPLHEWDLGVTPNQATTFPIDGGGATIRNGNLYVGPTGGYMIRIAGAIDSPLDIQTPATPTLEPTPTVEPTPTTDAIIIRPEATEPPVEGGDNLAETPTREPEIVPTTTPRPAGDVPVPTLGAIVPLATSEPWVEVNQGETAGRSFYVDEPPLDTGTDLASSTSTGSFAVMSSTVIGDVLVQVGIQTEGASAPGIRAINPESGVELWFVEGVFIPAIAGDSEHVYVKESVFSNDVEALPSHRLVALTLSEGTTVWAHELDPFTASDDPTKTGPVIANGVVYISDTVGRVAAFVAATGDVKWQQLEALTDGTPDEIARGGQLVLSDTALYVTAGSNTIAKLDPVTGKPIYVNELNGSEQVSFSSLALVSNGPRLFALAHVDSSGSESPERLRYSVLVAVDQETLVPRWQVALHDVVLGNIVATPDSLFVPILREDGSKAIVEFTTETGEETGVVIPLDSSVEHVSLVASGNVLYIVDDLGVYQVVDARNGEKVASIDIGTNGVQEIGPAAWLGASSTTMFVVTPDGTISMLGDAP